MPHFEHAVTVAAAPDRVAGSLSSPGAGPLFTPPIDRVTLDASDDGSAADATYEVVRTTAGGPPVAAADGRDRPARIANTFSGAGVEGATAYQLSPGPRGTELVQLVDYEFADWAAIGLLEPATVARNERRFATQLATVRDLIEAGSAVLDPDRGTTAASDSPFSRADRRPAASR